ncbi:endonuclease/exonuclease/phosphatase family protein [Brumimicrobium glaciale]|uniref:Endonuclease/exonuclease/phosphatase family protein n=1 Tax=Brumimicrobium glaciale TaxID=200475 RepID=A0A4Q4KGD6_9FLAO|nr:endonuclease/exonuclease/phosphatase family protein [Brumimicrobium glaciale]RYM32115.1 endonuclease/exonuclease/phosphatase family protein [Brumimicrobium glaciale]
MGIFFIILSILLILLSLLPLIQNQHWVFRASEFLSLQVFISQIIASIGLFIFAEQNKMFWVIVLVQFAFIIYHIYIFSKFTKFFKSKNRDIKSSQAIKVISTNIYQFNKDFDRFKKFIQKENPDIFITIESNKDWEVAMRDLEDDYPHAEKITLENTYGMHMYSKIPFEKITKHFYVADDVPSIEAHFKTKKGDNFILFSVHPPPPSPTEEENSKERDGDLLCIAKRSKELEKPTLVIGDFNTVAWSKISILFRKNSGLIDGRHGRGILASFHAKYWLLRAPLDLVFHSSTIFIKELKVLENIGSDHFPICCEFYIDSSDSSQKNDEETLSTDEDKETEEIIEEGKKEKSENRN